jgi:glycosyltransferase involved in cell wall biosynthesis
MKKMAIAITSAFPLNVFLRPHLERLQRDFEITVYVNTTDMGVAPAVPAGVKVVHLQIRREISPLADMATLWRLWRILRREGYDVLLSMNPKSGLLAMMAACAARVPLRVHCFTGQVWATKQGPMKSLLKALDWLTANCATRVLADSPSQREFLVAQRVVRPERISVMADGSIAGVDVGRFCPSSSRRAAIRQMLGIPEQAVSLLYVGRLKKEKGVVDLLHAFTRLRERWPDLWLLLVGPDDEGLDSFCRGVPGTYRIDYTPLVEEYMAAADIYCLPSYREGFGLVLVEAGAVGLPVVASRIYGITDAVVDGETGLLHEVGNVMDLSDKIEALLINKELRHRLGEGGRRRAVQFFQSERLTEVLADILLDRDGAQGPTAEGNHHGS